MASFDIFERKTNSPPEPRTSNTFDGGHRRFVFQQSEARKLPSLEPIDTQEGLLDHADANYDPIKVRTTPQAFTAQVAAEAEQVPEGPSWLHEIELNGYRVLAHIGDQGVHLRRVGARTEGDDKPSPELSGSVAGLAAELATPGLANSVLDGVVCALGPDGVTCVKQLEQALADGRDAQLVFFAFDMLVAGGQDLRRNLLIERKRALRERIEGPRTGPTTGRIRFCEHVVGAGTKVFDRACELGVEGVVSKRIDSTYEGGQSRAWLAVKCARRLSLVVAGFTAPHGSRRHFGALLVGSYDDAGRLHYRGKVGSGFCEDSLEQLRPRLDGLRQEHPAFIDPPKGSQARGVNWVEPTLVVDVEYGELTPKGRLRHARFKGLHDQPGEHAHDGDHRAQPLEQAEFAMGTLSDPDQLLYPARGLSKRDLADYAAQIAELMLPHICGRALTLVRCPEGVDGQHVTQDHETAGLDPSICALCLDGPDGTSLRCLSICDALGLIGLVEMSALEIHTSSSRIDKLDHPDRLVFGLEPGEGLGFADVVQAALEIRDGLDEVGLVSFVKTTGGDGLDVVVPVQRRRSFGLVERFCQVFAQSMVAAAPDRYISGAGVDAGPDVGRGKIVIDPRCNARGAVSLAPFSPRAKPDALVSTPLHWHELVPELRPQAFSVATVPTRLAGLASDPWAEFFELRQWITKASFRALGLDPDAASQLTTGS